jgi:hypothetical protein
VNVGCQYFFIIFFFAENNEMTYSSVLGLFVLIMRVALILGPVSGIDGDKGR